MKNRKGFTLVELLVVIVIIGVITGLSWPILRRVQDSSKMSKYEKYGDSLVAAAKLYVDSYEEDIFNYEDDLSEAQKNQGQCTYIMYEELKEHALIKDYNVDGMSCNSDATFVKVTRKKGNYTYQFFLGCGDKKADGSKLSEDEVYFTLPVQNQYNVPDYAACGTGVTEYRMTYDSNGGTHCRTKIGYKDAAATAKWGQLCSPTRQGYTFTGWKDGAGHDVTATTLITGNITVSATWRINKVYIKLHSNGGVLAASHGANITLTADGLLRNSGSDVMNTINYGGTMTVNGLWDYNSAAGVNLTKPGYHGYAAKEWNTEMDGKGTSYNQTTVYRASDFCDASVDDCTVVLYVNWQPNKVYINYHANGGTLIDEHHPNFTQVGDKLQYSGHDYASVINYGGTISNLWDYNYPTHLNVVKEGYHAAAATAWNTKADGTGTSYDQRIEYNASDFCDATNGDCTVDLYVKWVINKVYIHYNANGGSLLPNHNAEFTQIGDTLLRNNSENVQTVNYGATLSDLYNYNNPEHLNLGKVGYHAEITAAWNTKPDGTGRSYHQAQNIPASDLCAATYNNCTVTVYANWTINKIRVTYDLNGGSLKNPHEASITANGNTILRNGSEIAQTWDYGVTMDGNGLWNYNNNTWLNTERAGCHVNAHNEWNTQSDGNGISFDHAYSYAAANMCDATYNNCTRRLYVNWICS